MVTYAALRQERFRANQQSKGLVQVRAWVPSKHAKAYKAIAIVMRADERIEPPEPITGKQRYELRKLQASMSKTRIPERVWNCRWRAEVYLTMYGRETVTVTARDISDCLKPHINRLLTVAEVALEGQRYEAFRKVVLEELGHKGFEKTLDDLFDKEGKR